MIVRSVEEIGWAVTSRGGPVETAGKIQAIVLKGVL